MGGARVCEAEGWVGVKVQNSVKVRSKAKVQSRARWNGKAES